MTSFAVGSLVRARGREWVVLSESQDDLLVVRPLAGGETDIAGILPALEPVESASFAPPTAQDLGNARSARLLREAVRIGFKATGGPFRSVGSLAVDPRPYQYVPLLMALRQEVVRLLIADDVGIGKTIEAGLIAAELLAQGSAKRLSILCPPSLAEQWQGELRDKFGLEAELVLGSTVARLERSLSYGESVFERYPITIVSTDYIKSDRRRDDFLRAAPELVIVDEAHTCVADDAPGGGKGRTQRYRLLKDLAQDETRHLILVSATPHSGNEGAFRNMLGLLDPALHDVSLDSEKGRTLLARHLVQRRRSDIRTYLDEDTKFPKDRLSKDVAFKLSPAYREVFEDALAWARGVISDESAATTQGRVQWWSVLAMLRSIASSPAAAAATLRARSLTAGAPDVARADELGRAAVMDKVEDDSLESDDAVPGSLFDDSESVESTFLMELASRAEALSSQDDLKLKALLKEIKSLRKAGVSPIVFCRFIPTAHYVKDYLRGQFGNVAIEVVTGELAPSDRAQRVEDLLDRDQSNFRILVATDCLSEGVNLQTGFQAVIHYDLAWNPTRHEQREGRVDRFGQEADAVHAITMYGSDNGIDGIVLNVLLKKHEAIRKALGVSVPVPDEANDKVMNALLEGLILRGATAQQDEFDLGLEALPDVHNFTDEWQSAVEKEKVSRTLFAQRAIHPDEVRAEVEEVRGRLGQPRDVAAFVSEALHELNVDYANDDQGIVLESDSLSRADLRGLRDAIRPGEAKQLKWVRDLPAPRGAAVLVRTDERVGALARFVVDAALDVRAEQSIRIARRGAVVETASVTRPTTCLLARFRVHVTLPGREGPRTEVAEEVRLLAFTGVPISPQWLSQEDTEALLESIPSGNVPQDRAIQMFQAISQNIDKLQPELERQAHELADQLKESHSRVRLAARGRERAGSLTVVGLAVEPQLPVDLLGMYLFLPGGRA